MGEKKIIHIENTKFIYQTNFSGDPERDRFGSSDRKANIIIPDERLAEELLDIGVNVKRTKPKASEDEEFEPVYFVPVKANYDSAWPPKIYLVSGDAAPRLLDEVSVGTLDNCYVLNVDVVLSTYFNPMTNRTSLYIRTMYVVQDVEDDPFANKYM